MSVDQAPSPKEALQPEDSRGSSNGNNQSRNNRGQNGSQTPYNAQKLVGPPPLLPPPDIPLHDSHQAPSGANNNGNYSSNASQYVQQKQSNQAGVPATNVNRQQSQYNNGPSVNSNNAPSLALTKSNSPVKPVNSSSNESSGGKSTVQSSRVEKQTTSDTSGGSSQLVAGKRIAMNSLQVKILI